MCTLARVRDGPRSEQTPLSLAVVDALNHHLETSPLRSVHGLSKAVPTVSRSQLYLLMRGQSVIDVAELFAICDALGVSPRQVLAEAEAAVDERPVAGRRRVGGVAAYDETHAIEEEQEHPEEP